MTGWVDIDSAARPTAASGLAWDIGADQTAVKIYRSIAPSATAALTTGASNALSISSSTSLATLSVALPDNVGVGDVIIYNTGGTATGTAFIHVRSSSTVYTVKTASGTLPTAVSADTSWSIYRAYTSLSNAEAGTENTGIPSAMRNFDAWSGGADLVASNTQMNIAAYANGTTADADAVVIDGWTTGAQNFIKMYTPVNTTEVGTTQRHPGKWDGTKYNLTPPDTWAIDIKKSYVRIDGVQISLTYGGSAGGILLEPGATSSDVRISNNILRSVGGGPNGIRMDSGTARMWNNLVYDIGGWGGTRILGGTAYIYNSLAYNNYQSFSADAPGVLIGKNLIAYKSGWYFGQTCWNCDPSSSNNLEWGEHPVFVDEANRDFHLSPTDTVAIDAGFNNFSYVSVVQDNFNRASLGSNWTQQPGDSGTVVIDSSTRIAAQDGADAYAYWSASLFSADQYSQAKLVNVNGSDDSGVYVRGSSVEKTFYWFTWLPSGSSWDIHKYINGVFTNLISTTSGAAQVGDVMKLTAVGNIITAYVNGVQKLQVTDSSITDGAPGVYVGSSDTYIDDWEGGSIGSLTVPNLVFSFTDDIDGQTRRQWDIGADEASVEFVTSVMQSGGNFSTLSAWEAANQVDLATTSTAVFSLSSASGTIPASASIMGLTSGAVASTTVGSVSTSTQILLYNIASSTFISGERIYIKGGATTSNYAIISNAGNPAIATAKIDGAWTGADTTAVTINGWTTGPNNYIRVYTTPTARHNGTSNTGYKFNASGFWSAILNIAEDYVRIDGLIITYSSDFTTPIAYTGAGELQLSNNIIYSTATAKYNGIDFANLGSIGNNGVVKIWNNIIYDMGSYPAIYANNWDKTGLTFIVYNNTVSNSGGIFDMGALTFDNFVGSLYLKNNTVQSGTAGYKDYLLNPTTLVTANNISKDNTSPDASFRNKTVTFVDAANKDFHLAPTDTAAKDAGVDLAGDIWIPASAGMTKDIDGQYRGTQATTTTGGLGWDIGADEGATIMYRSVGNDTSNLNTGGATVTIASSTATFNVALPNNVGVGDVIQYGGPLTLAFITGRSSSTVYSIVSATSSYPIATTSASVAVYRAHTLLNNWQTQTTGTVNQSIDSGLRNQVLVARALVAFNTAMFVPAYASSSPDTTGVNIQTWTTGAGNYIKVYTSVSSSEVGVSQRHQGKWDEGKYRLVTTSGGGILIKENYIKIDGIQSEISAPNYQAASFRMNEITGSGLVEISNSIGKETNKIGEDYWNSGIMMWPPSPNIILKAWNNIFYDFDGSIDGVGIYADGLQNHIYNNTIYNSRYGILASRDGYGITYAKNNISYNNTDNYSGTFSATSTNNLSGPTQTDAPGSNPQNAKVVNFLDAANRDFHLAPTDRAARDAGVSLAADTYLPFTVDIDGDTRPKGSAWDIGADEDAASNPDYRFNGWFKLKGFFKFR